jgi:serine/threonine protein kinase
MMSDGEDRDLERLAEAVADGSGVDWAREEAERPDLAPELRTLAAVALIRTSSTETLTVETGAKGEARAVPAPPFTWGQLRVLEKLGQGSFGEVYRAFDPALEIEIALKLRRSKSSRDPESTEIFLGEARRLARIRHPNVLLVYGADVHDGRIGIWTELIEGETLEEFVLRHGPLGPSEALGVGLHLCRALTAVHAAGLVHRDVKTENVMRERGGRIVLMDLGSGGELPPEGQVFETQHLHGTPVYMAPEQLEGRIAGAASDIYAVGVVLYRLVCREFPVFASSISSLIAKHERGPDPLLDRRPDLPPEFLRVVERALARRPEDRFRTAGAMEAAIVEAIGSRREVPGSDVRVVPPKAWWRRPVILGGALGAGVAAALVAGFLVTADRWTHHDPLPSQSGTEREVRGHPLTATATMFRHTASADEPLVPGDRVKPGDQLSMTIQGSDSMYLYLLNEDAMGEVHVLFPLPGVAPGNPLSAGALHQLPGRQAGRRVYWTITSPGERESIIAFASPQAFPALEDEIRSFPKAKPETPIRLAPKTMERLRGIGGLTEEPAAPSNDRRLADVLSRIAEREEPARRPWVWQIELENPAPGGSPAH